MELVWTKTGDTLQIMEWDSEFVDYWLTNVKQTNKEKFNLVTPVPDYKSDELKLYVDQINEYLRQIDLELPVSSNVLDQDYLNLLHKSYVIMQHNRNIVDWLNLVGGPEAVKVYRAINGLIHNTERMVEYAYQGVEEHWSVPNPFGAQVLKFGTWQVELEYESLGRSSYEKYLNYDFNFIDDEVDNFQKFGARVKFNLGKPVIYDSPTEYFIIWQKNFFCAPIGYTLPIGNFAHTIGEIRTVFYQNSRVDDNPITFHR